MDRNIPFAPRCSNAHPSQQTEELSSTPMFTRRAITLMAAASSFGLYYFRKTLISMCAEDDTHFRELIEGVANWRALLTAFISSHKEDPLFIFIVPLMLLVAILAIAFIELKYCSNKRTELVIPNKSSLVSLLTPEEYKLQS